MPNAEIARTIICAPRLRSVRARTTLVATTAVALILVAAVVALALGVEQALTNRVLDQAETEIDAVVERLQAGATPAEALEPDITTQPGESGAPTYVAIFDAEGSPVTGIDFLADLPGVMEDGVGVGVETSRAGNVEVIHLGSNLAIAQRSIQIDGQELLVGAASPLGDVINTVNTVIGLARIGVPLLVVLVALITWIATGRTMRPIETIRTEVEALSSQTLDQRVAVPATNDEVSRLAETMNEMLTRLEAASLRQQEFVSDASHELRSPVASIRAELEVSLAHPADRNWSEVANDVLAETGRLEWIIDDLLLLARFDEGVDPPTAIVDTRGIIRQLTSRVDSLNGVAIDTHTVDGVLVRGNHNALNSVVRNLVDNAARHAKSTIAVAATGRNNTVVITVDDDGPGIPPPDRQRVFERFTRLDQPRSRADGGVGLGLAVVDRVVRHHRGTITVTEAPLGGARFEVVLPAAPENPQIQRSPGAM